VSQCSAQTNIQVMYSLKCLLELFTEHRNTYLAKKWRLEILELFK
jgi:hypothetical protein